MSLQVVTKDQMQAVLDGLTPKRAYKAMYSTLFKGVVTDPSLMLIPIDDHMVHRGDGVFEAIRVTKKGPFLLRAHIERLFRSAAAIDLKIPLNLEEIENICRELPKIGKVDGDAMLRLFVSRGPGDFSPNPYTTIGSQLYILAMNYKPMAKDKYENGVSVMVSGIPVKHSPYVQIKSCNYLPNVMMKKESLDAGYEFSIGMTPDGYLAEGPTENIAIVDKNGDLVAPKFDYSLKGTTLMRGLQLAEKLKGQGPGKLRDIRTGDLKLKDFQEAREIMMIGTTLAALGVTKFGGVGVAVNSAVKVGDGKPGPITRQLCDLLHEDMGI